jgi:hypothetical protein
MTTIYQAFVMCWSKFTNIVLCENLIISEFLLQREREREREMPLLLLLPKLHF